MSIAIASAAFITVTSVAINPVQAALIDFNFITKSGATGTFTLNTNTPPSPEPAIFRFGARGISYSNAISDFSISASYLNLSSVTADYNIAPSITSNVLGFPTNLGVLSGVSYPSGCITAPSFTCLFNVSQLYSGNLSELPALSDNPLSYLQGVGIDFIDPITRESLRDDIINLQAVRRKAVPEPNTYLGTLALGVCGVALQMKRKMKPNGNISKKYV
ncbi:PEP-CTERM sorting domain-containing protein [Rivularia sp. UHCC 0363]|uniref:PEP-CTERM sorting domain-containing protein n=1 Tax=Rivularia sp. UHCC 0363 TaxID=3110244 RepID=UPI002B1F3187|nr:PEP-CTERM sorting domain-containing protein [Rivularia sp. UHCC 0363]MEA5595750.1 PEP-CTERM sorting domain-containing protein [Rivularia sp. UHCC 0363]